MKVILSIDEGKAYIQNADTNAYLEGKLEVKADLVNGKVPMEQLPAMGYTKEEVLTDANKAAFGLGSAAVPAEVFARLGQYAQHWWSVLHGQAQTIYVENKAESWTSADLVAVTSTGTWNIQIADSVDVDPATGVVTLHNPTTYTVNGTSDDDGKAALTSAIRGRYILGAKFDQNNIYFIPAGMSVTYAGNVVINNYYNPIYRITAIQTTTPEGETTYVHSSDRTAYPDSGTVGGLTYTYLGVPFNNAVAPVKIVTGSYTGTGTYGASNPNSLTFDFEPKLVMLLAMESSSGSYYTLFGVSEARQGIFAIHPHTLGANYKQYAGFYVESATANNSYAKKTGNTIYWYATSSASNQANNSGFTYHYMAIG